MTPLLIAMYAAASPKTLASNSNTATQTSRLEAANGVAKTASNEAAARGVNPGNQDALPRSTPVGKQTNHGSKHSKCQVNGRQHNRDAMDDLHSRVPFQVPQTLSKERPRGRCGSPRDAP